MFSKLISRATFKPANARAFTASYSQSVQLIQSLPSYEKALKEAHEHRYEASLTSLKATLEELSQQIGPYSGMHIYIHQRIASIQQLLGDLPAVEDTYKKCISIAENSPASLLQTIDVHKSEDDDSRTQQVFMWQNNLLKFYLEHEVFKAVEYGSELVDEVAPLLPNHLSQDLKLSVGTAHSLLCSDLDQAIKLYNEALELGSDGNDELTSNSQIVGIIKNNLGMTHAYKFIDLSNQVEDPNKLNPDMVKPIIDSANSSIKTLKESVLSLENLKEKLAHFDEMEAGEETEMKVMDVQLKLLVDEFFNPEIHEIAKPDFKSYNLMDNAKNDQFLQATFTNSPSILPIQNLGEMAFVMGKAKEAFAFLDMSLKLYRHLDGGNLLKYKNLTLLGCLLEQQNELQVMEQIFKMAFDGFDMLKRQQEEQFGTMMDPNSVPFEKVFTLQNYGLLLQKHEETRLKGVDYLKQAEELSKQFPFWAERKMNLFVPVMNVLDETMQQDQ